MMCENGQIMFILLSTPACVAPLGCDYGRQSPQSVAEKCRQYGSPQAKVVLLDVLAFATHAGIADGIVAEFGHIDVLVRAWLTRQPCDAHWRTRMETPASLDFASLFLYAVVCGPRLLVWVCVCFSICVCRRCCCWLRSTTQGGVSVRSPRTPTLPSRMTCCS